jgi:para-nitrobenzyl esterase
MRSLILAAAALAIATPALAQTAAPAAAAPAAKVKYSTSETDLGTLLDNPAAKAIIEKHIPGMTTNDQVDMARGMTLKAIQQYASDEVTDARLAAIDADLAKLP